jgi:hypothetical protein
MDGPANCPRGASREHTRARQGLDALVGRNRIVEPVTRRVTSRRPHGTRNAPAGPVQYLTQQHAAAMLNGWQEGTRRVECVLFNLDRSSSWAERLRLAKGGAVRRGPTGYHRPRIAGRGCSEDPLTDLRRSSSAPGWLARATAGNLLRRGVGGGYLVGPGTQAKAPSGKSGPWVKASTANNFLSRSLGSLSIRRAICYLRPYSDLSTWW